MNESDALELLQEGSPAAFRINDEGIGWRHFYLGQPQLRQARREVIIAFGSCSFTEPISELQSLHLLEPRVSQA
jgi:hypothetical protein